MKPTTKTIAVTVSFVLVTVAVLEVGAGVYLYRQSVSRSVAQDPAHLVPPIPLPKSSGVVQQGTSRAAPAYDPAHLVPPIPLTSSKATSTKPTAKKSPAIKK